MDSNHAPEETGATEDALEEETKRPPGMTAHPRRRDARALERVASHKNLLGGATHGGSSS